MQLVVKYQKSSDMDGMWFPFVGLVARTEFDGPPGVMVAKHYIMSAVREKEKGRHHICEPSQRISIIVLCGNGQNSIPQWPWKF